VTGSLVSPQLRAAVRGIAGPIARGLGKLGLSPNQLTVMGFLISAAGGGAAALEHWLLAAWLVILGGVFDLFDGALARATGRTSRFGALMDSSFDRWGEAVVYGGIATGMASAGIVTGTALAALATGSSFLVSYVRARAEGLGFSAGTGMAAVGLAPREIRLVVVTVGLFLVEPLGGVSRATDGSLSRGALALLVILGVLFVLTTLTVAQRMAYTARQAARQSTERQAPTTAAGASARQASSPAPGTPGREAP
jgi:CDP-diacylglycerol--glycerol-3-phosphate 3-phosphatidyltransferase